MNICLGGFEWKLVCLGQLCECSCGHCVFLFSVDSLPDQTKDNPGLCYTSILGFVNLGKRDGYTRASPPSSLLPPSPPPVDWWKEARTHRLPTHFNPPCPPRYPSHTHLCAEGSSSYGCSRAIPSSNHLSIDAQLGHRHTQPLPTCCCLLPFLLNWNLPNFKLNKPSVNKEKQRSLLHTQTPPTRSSPPPHSLVLSLSSTPLTPSSAHRSS